MFRPSDDQKEKIFWSEVTLTALQGAGWYPKRNVEISHHVKALQGEGYQVFPVVQEFLKQFGGLKIEDGAKCAKWQNWTKFDAAFDAKALMYERVEEYEKYLGTSLCLIGVTDNGHTTLLMDPKGRVIGVYDEGIVLCGETWKTAIENLITNQNIKVLR